MNCQRLLVSIFWIVLALFPVYACGVEGDADSELKRDVKIMIFGELRGLMDNPIMQSELEVSDEQLKEVGEILDQVDKGKRRFNIESLKLNVESLKLNVELLRLQSRPAPGASIEEVTQQMKTNSQAMNELLDFNDVAYDSLKEVLLPHQIKRIQQITQQARIITQSNKGFIGILSAPVKLKELVGLTAKECEELQPRLDEIESKYAKKLAALKAETYQAVLDELDDEQRRKMDTLIGPPFDFEESQRVWNQAQTDKFMAKYKDSKKDKNRAKSD